MGRAADREITGVVMKKFYSDVWSESDRLWIEQLPELVGIRKMRLMISAWCRELTLQRFASFTDTSPAMINHMRPIYMAALDVNDRYADTGKSKTALKAARSKTYFRHAYEAGGISMMFDTLLTEDSLFETIDRGAVFAMNQLQTSPEKSCARLRSLVMDVIPPEGVVSIEKPPIKKSLAYQLAAHIYDEYCFDEMSKLGEILRDAGCQNEVILAHCMSEAGHLRGCWVLDWILQKNE